VPRVHWFGKVSRLSILTGVHVTEQKKKTKADSPIEKQEGNTLVKWERRWSSAGCRKRKGPWRPSRKEYSPENPGRGGHVTCEGVPAELNHGGQKNSTRCH